MIVFILFLGKMSLKGMQINNIEREGGESMVELSNEEKAVLDSFDVHPQDIFLQLKSYLVRVFPPACVIKKPGDDKIYRMYPFDRRLDAVCCLFNTIIRLMDSSATIDEFYDKIVDKRKANLSNILYEWTMESELEYIRQYVTAKKESLSVLEYATLERISQLWMVLYKICEGLEFLPIEPDKVKTRIMIDLNYPIFTRESFSKFVPGDIVIVTGPVTAFDVVLINPDRREQDFLVPVGTIAAVHKSYNSFIYLAVLKEDIGRGWVHDNDRYHLQTIFSKDCINLGVLGTVNGLGEWIDPNNAQQKELLKINPDKLLKCADFKVPK